MIRIVLHSPPLSLADVARMAGVSKQRILNLCHEGRIEGAFHLSGCWLFSSNFVIKPGKNDGGGLKRRASSLAEYKALPTSPQSERPPPSAQSPR